MRPSASFAKATASQIDRRYKSCGRHGRLYTADLRQAPRTRPLIAKPRSGRPMSMQMSGQGFVSKAENTEMVAYSTNKNANQQMSATPKPQTARSALSREI